MQLFLSFFETSDVWLQDAGVMMQIQCNARRKMPSDCSLWEHDWPRACNCWEWYLEQAIWWSDERGVIWKIRFWSMEPFNGPQIILRRPTDEPQKSDGPTWWPEEVGRGGGDRQGWAELSCGHGLRDVCQELLTENGSKKKGEHDLHISDDNDGNLFSEHSVDAATTLSTSNKGKSSSPTGINFGRSFDSCGPLTNCRISVRPWGDVRDFWQGHPGQAWRCSMLKEVWICILVAIVGWTLGSWGSSSFSGGTSVCACIYEHLESLEWGMETSRG